MVRNIHISKFYSMGNEWPAYVYDDWDALYTALPIAAVFAGNLLLGVIVQLLLRKDNSWIDAWWGMSILLPNIIVLIIRDQNSDYISVRSWIMTVCVGLWALRLSVYIWLRHKSEDYRYKKMREDWSSQGVINYYAKAFGFIYFGQGVFSIITNASVLYVNIQSIGVIYNINAKQLKTVFIPDNRVYALDIIGLLIFLLGFGIEIVSDWQLSSHLKNPRPGTTKFIKSGLWRYSRHPNYFGEAMLWWGLYLIACNVQYGWATFFAPLFITFMLRFVSGVPFPEKKYKDNPEWQQYCRETNCFVPWFYKSDSQKDQFLR